MEGSARREDAAEGQEQQHDIPEEAQALLDGVETQAPEREGEQQAEQGPKIPTRDLVVPVVALLCNTVAPAWKITPAEQGGLADAYAAVLDKYFPDGLAMGPEVAAILVTAAVVMPRIGQPMKDEPQPEGGEDGAQAQAA